MFIEGGEKLEMMWGDWGFGSEVIVNGRPEGISIVMEILNLGSM